MPSKAAAIRVSLLEPFIFLRSSKDALDSQEDRPLAVDDVQKYQHLDENYNQVRGLVFLNHDRIPPTTTQVQISFRGVSVWVDWTGKSYVSVICRSIC
jgi:hypothetical protein